MKLKFALYYGALFMGGAALYTAYLVARSIYETGSVGAVEVLAFNFCVLTWIVTINVAYKAKAIP